jgi:hypothetical protein
MPTSTTSSEIMCWLETAGVVKVVDPQRTYKSITYGLEASSVTTLSITCSPYALAATLNNIETSVRTVQNTKN